MDNTTEVDKLATKVEIDKIISENEKRAFKQTTETIKNVYSKFEKIEQKEKCLRVKFLDWLSAKLSDYSERLHKMSVNIDTPCVIKLPTKGDTK